MIFQLEW